MDKVVFSFKYFFLYKGDSRLFRPGFAALFFFIQVCYGWPQKMTHQVSDFFEKKFGSNGRNRREMRAVIDFDDNKKFETNFIMSKTLFWVAQLKPIKTKKNLMIFLPTPLKLPHSLRANFVSVFFRNLFSNIFFLSTFFFTIIFL